MRQDQTTGNAEFWCPVKGRCYYVPRTKVHVKPTFQQKLRAILHRHEQAAPRFQDAAAPVLGLDNDPNNPHAQNQNALSLESVSQFASAYTVECPVQSVNVVFNGDNLWFNMQRHSSDEEGGAKGITGLLKTDWDLENLMWWKPLFHGDKEKEKM
jgi:hypothetical protein